MIRGVKRAATVRVTVIAKILIDRVDTDGDEVCGNRNDLLYNTTRDAGGLRLESAQSQRRQIGSL